MSVIAELPPTAVDFSAYFDPRGASLREVSSMAAPVVVTMASATLMGFVDSWMVSKVSKTDFAAVTPAALMAFTLIAFIDGLSTTNNTFVSQNFGRRDYRECARFTWHALYLALALGVLVQALQPLAPVFFGTHAENVRVREVGYFRIRLAGAGLFGMVVALANFYQGISRPRITMVIALAANTFNVGLNYLLIYGRLGFPRLEIRGAALGTVIASGIQVLLLLGVFLSGPFHARFGTRSARRFEFQRLRRFLRVGAPVGFHFFADVASWTVFVALLVGHFGETQLAASNAVGQLIHLSWLPTIGLNIAATQLTGQWIGRGRADIAKKRAWTALAIGASYMATMGLLLYVFWRPLLSIFRTEPEVLLWGHRIIIWAALFQVFDAIGIVCYGALKGAGDTLWPAVVVIGSAYVVFLPMGLLFSRGLGLEAPGAWMGATVHIILIAVLIFWRFHTEKWRKFQIVPAPAAVKGGA